MGERKKDAWLAGAGDLKEKVVEGVPVSGESVRVRALPAYYSNEAVYKALEMEQDGRGNKQTARVNAAELAVLKFQYGVVDPVFTYEESKKISQLWGAAFDRVVEAIDELSEIDEEAVKAAEARFQGSGDVADGGATPKPPAGAS